MLTESYFGNETIFVKYLPDKIQSFIKIPGYVSTLNGVLKGNTVDYNEINKFQELLDNADEQQQDWFEDVYGSWDEEENREIDARTNLQRRLNYLIRTQKQMGKAIYSSEGMYGAYLYQIHYDGPVIKTPWDIHTAGWAGKPEVKIKPQDLVKIVSANTIEDGYKIYQKLGYPTFKAERKKLPGGAYSIGAGGMDRFEGVIVNNLPAHSMMKFETIINVPCRHTLIGVPDEEFGVIPVDQIMGNIE
jgi:hypothetical protein